MTASIVYDRSRQIIPKAVLDIDVMICAAGDVLVELRRGTRGQLWERIAEVQS